MSIRDKFKDMRKAVAEKIYQAPPVVPVPEPLPSIPMKTHKPVIRMIKSDCENCKCRALTGHPCHRLENYVPHSAPRATNFDKAILYYHVDDEKTRTTRMCEKYMATVSFCVDLSVDRDLLRKDEEDAKVKMRTLESLERWLHNKIHERVYGEVCKELHVIQGDLMNINDQSPPSEAHEVSRKIAQLINKLSGN